MTENLKKAPFAKEELVTLLIEDLTDEGEGIGKVEGYTIFVHNALPGDRVVAKLIKVKKSYAIGVIEETIERSPDRVKAPCPFASRCGGCQLQDLSYEAQLKFKEKSIKDSLVRIGKIDEDALNYTGLAGMEEPLFYRNKGIYQLAPTGDGGFSMGYYRKRSHDLIDVDQCLIQSKAANSLMKKIRESIKLSGLSFYNEATQKGTLRRIMIRTTSPIDGSTPEAMVVVVVKDVTPKAIRIVKDFQTLDERIQSIYVNQNSDPGNTALSEDYQHIAGKTHLIDYIGDVAFRISPESFFQVNNVQSAKLYDEVVKNVELIIEARQSDKTIKNPKDIAVMDLYCGIGSISTYVAKKIDGITEIIGVEVIESAIDDAKENAELNGIKNTSYYVGKAEEIMPMLAEDAKKPEIVILDPPRKGCEESLLQILVDMAVENIIYVSCKPSTLARDLAFLTANGYELKRTSGVDMFPMSTHVETVTLLTKVL